MIVAVVLTSVPGTVAVTVLVITLPSPAVNVKPSIEPTLVSDNANSISPFFKVTSFNPYVALISRPTDFP